MVPRARLLRFEPTKKEFKMKTLLIFLMLFFTLELSAYTRPTYMDIKPASQAMLEKQDFGIPAAVSSTSLLSSHAGTSGTSASVTVTSFATQNDVPRNLVITPGGTTTDIEACTIVVNGTNYHGRSISENFAFVADTASATTGVKAFKTVTSVVFPVDCESGGFAATWSVGRGEAIGLKRCMDVAGFWSWSTVGGAYESTRATIVADADEVEKNTADFNGTMNASNRFFGFFVQNFAQACQP